MVKIQLSRVYLGYDDTFIIPILKIAENNYLCIKNCSKYNKIQAQIYHYDAYGRCFGITWMDAKQFLPKHNSLYIQNKEMIQKMKKFCKDKDYQTLKKYLIIELENDNGNAR
jgi:hypothetical protein